MRNKLCMLWLLLGWFSVQVAQAQKLPSVFTPEHVKALSETAEINKMLLMRQNPQSVTKETHNTLATEKAKQRENPTLALSPTERDAATRQKMKAYFDAHPEEGAKYNWGNIPPAQGALAVMEAQGVKKIDQVNLDKLTDAQKAQLFETEPMLKQMWSDNVSPTGITDKQTQDQIRKKIWASYVKEQLNQQR